MRMVEAKKLAPETKLKVIASAKKTPSLMVEETDVPAECLKDVNYATVILGPATGREGLTVWTVFAGHPTPLFPIEKDADKKPVLNAEGNILPAAITGLQYGDVISPEQARQKLGEDFYVSIK